MNKIGIVDFHYENIAALYFNKPIPLKLVIIAKSTILELKNGGKATVR